MNQNDWDVIIAGGGPAGLSAALLLGRSRRSVLVIDAGSPRNRFADHMHGVLGREGVPPEELLDRGRSEASAYGVEFTASAVAQVTRREGGLAITTGDGTTYSARALIVATGVSDELPAIEGLQERWGTTVLHCPYCHGWEVRDQHLGVLTTSPFSLHQAELIRQWSDRVTVFTSGLGQVAPETQQRLRARGITLEAAPVTAILGEGSSISGVRLAGSEEGAGREVAVDAIFTMGTPRPHDSFLDSLELTRNDSPFGPFLAVDATGRTSDERIWAIGNVVNPAANVPMSIGAGAFTAGAVNSALVSEDFDRAVHQGSAARKATPKGFWEDRYAASDRVWSGKVNAVLADVARTLTPGRALDLGCGEGADVLWLAQQGWDATGVDIASTAIRRAEAAAEAAGIDAGRARFMTVELTTADLTAVPSGVFDLVSASFLHSPVELPRTEILRQAATRVAPGGHLLITSHAAMPPGADVPDGHHHEFLSAPEELEQLNLDPAEWDVVHAELRTREAVRPDGSLADLDDVVVLARRR